MKWSDLSGTAIIHTLASGDAVMVLRTSDTTDGSKIMDIDEFATELVNRISEMTVGKLTVTTQVVPPIDEITFSGDVTLVLGSSKTELFFNDGGADRILTMPADAVQAWVLRHAVGSHTITIKTSLGVTITTLAPGETKNLTYSGTRWNVY